MTEAVNTDIRPASDSSAFLRINNFDLIRLLAASQVVAIHVIYFFKLYPKSDFGNFLLVVLQNFPGVPIFFVISGFLISLSWERSHSPRIYTMNRFLRLFPALWVCLLITIIVLIASGYLGSAKVPFTEFIKWTFWQATIFQTYNPAFLHGFGAGAPNGALWSIPVEMQFYVVLPLMYLVLPRSRKGFLIAMAICTVCLAIASEWLAKTQVKTTPMGYWLLVISCLPYIYMFLLGVILQKTLQWIMPMLKGLFIPWLVLYLAIVLSLHYGFGWQTGIRLGTNNPPILISVIMAIGTISAAYTWPTLSKRILRGHDISYGTYIYHMVFVNLVLYLGITMAAWQLIIVIGATFTCATLSWFFIERPALSLKRKTLHRLVPDKNSG